MIFRGRWSLTLHWRSIFNLEVFEFNWKVNERRGIGRREDHLGPRTICFSSFYSSVWIRSHSRVDTNHVLRFTIACTYFVTAAHHPTHCQGMLGLNDATSTVESFPVFSFPQAFSHPQPTFEANWTNGFAVVILLSTSYSSLLICLLRISSMIARRSRRVLFS